MGKRKIYFSYDGNPAKKQCLIDIRVVKAYNEDEALLIDASPIKFFPLETLPAHILEKVIMNLDTKSILELTLTNKNLNEFISYNSMILDNFKIDFFALACIPEDWHHFESIRKYPNWSSSYDIRVEHLEIVVWFFERYGSNHVKSITIAPCEFLYDGRICNLMLSKILQVFSKVETLTVLHIFNDNQNEFLWDKTTALNLPNLKKLNFPQTFSEVLSLIKTSNLKELHLNIPYHSRFEVVNQAQLMDFLEKQSKLEVLCIKRFEPFLSNERIGNLTFKLKSLYLTKPFEPFYAPNIIQSNSLKKFISLQKDTLENLNIEKTDSGFFEHFDGFPHIKELLIKFCPNINSGMVMASVEKIWISTSPYNPLTSNLINLARKYPNLKEIILEGVNIRGDILRDLPKIEKLTMQYCHIHETVSFQNVEFLDIKKCKLMQTLQSGEVIITDFSMIIENLSP